MDLTSASLIADWIFEKGPAMQGTATVDPQRRFLRFQFEASATVRDWVEAQAIFLRLSEETGIRRALVDVRKQQVGGPALGDNLPSGMAFAVLSDPRSEDPKLVETVALNRGKNVRLFFGPEEEAIAWLMGAAR